MKYFWALVITIIISTPLAAQNQQGGIAIRFGIDTLYSNKQPLISWVLKGSPAEKAGLRAGHYIFFINNFDCQGKTPEEISNYIRGDVNSVMTIKYSGTAYANEFQLKECQVVRKKVTKTANGDVALCLEGDCDNGQGKLLINGETFEGTFKDGKFNGDFTIVRNNGKVEQKLGKDGEWLLQGKQKIENEFGRIEEATYVAGKREGEVIYTFTSGKKLVCNYKNGELQPGGTILFQNSMMPKLGKYEGEFVLSDENALPNGIGKYTFSDGTTYETEFIDGKNKPNVLITTTDPSGTVKYEVLNDKGDLVKTDAQGNIANAATTVAKPNETAEVKEQVKPKAEPKPKPEPKPKAEPKPKPEPKPKKEPKKKEEPKAEIAEMKPTPATEVENKNVSGDEIEQPTPAPGVDDVSGELYLVDFVNKMTDKLVGDGYNIVKKYKAPYCKSYSQMYTLQAGKTYNIYMFTQTQNMPVVRIDYGLEPEVNCKNLQLKPNRWLSTSSFTTTKEGSVLINVLTGINDCDEMWLLITN